MIVEFDTKKRHSLRAKDKNGHWHRVLGKCLRCGKCGCIKSKCQYLSYEKVDGKMIAKCLRQFEKPFLCAMFPYDPDSPLPKGCGFSWEKE